MSPGSQERLSPLWPAAELEAVACDYCRGAEARHVVTRPDGLEAVECRRCGLCYLSPRPRLECVGRFYGSEYYTKKAEERGRESLGYGDYFSARMRGPLVDSAAERLRIVSRFVNLAGADCLEVGCASGEASCLLSRAGARVVGIDVSGPAIREARKRYPKLEFLSAELASLPRQRQFDLALAFEVIEHVPSPSEFFGAAVRRLRPNGFLALSTPNYGCAKVIGAANWLGFKTSLEHLFYFDADSVSRYGARFGLTTVEWFTRGQGRVTAARASTDDNGLRAGARTLLRQAGLLRLVRAFRRGLSRRSRPPVSPPFVARGEDHNLLILMRKGPVL
jgi:2-polyprenyl-3-methyl-5-hydroxy-6-metoxy-1,4-benzoquinol methylase